MLLTGLSPNLLVHGLEIQSNKPLDRMWAVHGKTGMKLETFDALGILSHLGFYLSGLPWLLL